MKKFILFFLIIILSSCDIDYTIDRDDLSDEEYTMLIEEINNSVMDWVSERQSVLLKGDFERGCVEIDPGICDFEKQDNLMFSLTKVLAIFPVYTSEEGSTIEHFFVIVSDDNETQGMFITYTDDVVSYSWTYENLTDYYYNEKTNATLNRVVVWDWIMGPSYWSLNVTVNDSTQNIKVYNIVEFNKGIWTDPYILET